MAYEKQTWSDVQGETPVNADRLNHMEQGIEDAGKTGGVEVGTIVDWEDDVAIPEGYEEVTDPNEIIQLSDQNEIFTDKTGFSYLDGTLFRQRNRYFGNITVKKDSENFTSTADVVLGFAKKIKNYTNIGCYLGSSQWNTNAVGGCYIDPNGIQISDKNSSNKYNTAKIIFDVVTTEASTTKLIKKVAVSEIPEINGSIVDGTNIDDKTTNTYSANVIDGLLNGGKVKVKTLDITPTTFSNSTYLVTDIPMKNTSILSIFCKNRFGYNLIPLQYYNISSDKWVITDVDNSLTGTFSLTIVYFEFDKDINTFAN